MATYDVQAFYAGPNGIGIQSLANPINNGQLVTGGQKLLQRVVCRLFLVKGSIPYKTVGTNFLNMLQVTGANSENDIRSAFAGAQLDLTPQLQSEELPTDPSNERFASAVLNSVIVTIDKVLLNITVNSLAGLTINATLPLVFTFE